MPNCLPPDLVQQLWYVLSDEEAQIEIKIGLLMSTLLDSVAAHDAIMDYIHSTVARTCSTEVASLSRGEAGLHYNAKTITEAKLHEFDLGDLAATMRTRAPATWNLLDSLFSADPQQERFRERDRKHAKGRGKTGKSTADGDIYMGDATQELDDDEADYWKAVTDISQEKEIEIADAAQYLKEEHEKHLIIRKTVCLSVMLQSTNQRCNALQSFIGVFLQATNSPDTLRELLSRLGLSVSIATINQSIKSLSADADKAIQKAFDKMLALLALDNVDINLPHAINTSNEPTLVHLTSGTIIPLPDCVELADLDCSNELWEKSPNNLDAVEAGDVPKIASEELLTLFMDDNAPDDKGLQQRDRFNAWKFLQDLVNHGPEYFKKFKRDLGQPEEFDCIPVTKTSQTPCRIQKIHPATPAENAEAVEGFFQQAKVGDPDNTDTPGVTSPGNHVVLCYGDLLTGQHLRSLLESRGQEEDPWSRMQHVVYVMGLFHLKMAAADAIWRIFILPQKAKPDANTLIKHAGILRPKETGKIESKPGFRRMHEVIQHTGLVARLDCWRLEVIAMFPACASLDDFAKTQPSWDILQEISRSLCLKFGSQPEISQDHNPKIEHDQQYGNMLLRHEYFLLYEELSYAMNHGDVGRVERCMVPWMFIFSGCGKHKYATELQRYLENMHFIYPEGLRKAIRMSILANPTGKRDAFRAIDWIVEHNNLYIKRIYGGKFSNHQLERIITESPLIEVYKNTRRQLEKMFCLESYTTHHSPPDLSGVFLKLATHMKDNNTNVNLSPNKKRTSGHQILDIINEGMNNMVMSDGNTAEHADEADVERAIDEDDMEVEDDGSLEV